MLFGMNNRRFGQPAAPSMQPAAQPAFAAPTWPGQTPDGTYSQGLAGYYANQLQNQAVPGSAMPAQPQSQPLTNPVQSVQPAQQQQRPGDAFRQMLMGHLSQRLGSNLFAPRHPDFALANPLARLFGGLGQ